MGGVKKAVKSVVKGVGNLVTFGAVSAHDQAKAARKQAEAQAEAARLQAEAQEKIAAAQREATRKQEENAAAEAQAAKVAAANIPQEQQEAMASSLREDEANKLKRRRGMTGTILTSPLGTSGVTTGSNKLGVL